MDICADPQTGFGAQVSPHAEIRVSLEELRLRLGTILGQAVRPKPKSLEPQVGFGGFRCSPHYFARTGMKAIVFRR